MVKPLSPPQEDLLLGALQPERSLLQLEQSRAAVAETEVAAALAAETFRPYRGTC